MPAAPLTQTHPESVSKRLAAIDIDFSTADPLDELRPTQERFDLRAELDSMGRTIDPTALEAQFVKNARSQSARGRISHTSWRAVGRHTLQYSSRQE